MQLGAQHAYTTIATVLGNLDRKKLIVSSREGRAVKYTARCTREQHTARLMEVALDTSRDRAAAILHFVDSIDSHDLDLLREYLEQQKDRP
ncbi:putative transcriptional regulator [Leifsonia rubra CMS 76R]|nr:putative transcriptional regulator [Leifsonia rubra CMS 76R]